MLYSHSLPRITSQDDEFDLYMSRRPCRGCEMLPIVRVFISTGNYETGDLA